ncbi:unnamed protein product [Pedinophyceae sp. YPF-701]|nr:unnamed protein product [Pedinophyceae sp. YPF-701]
MTSQTFERRFQDVDYFVSVESEVENGPFTVEVERKTDGQLWKRVLSDKYVQELTSKAGSAKSLPVFRDMLIAALHGSSTSVSVELLTYSDLEALRHRTTGAAHASTQPSGPSKRYFILTYSAEFDRVHYPLPIEPSAPDAARLQRMLGRIRAENEALRGAAALGAVPGSRIHEVVEEVRRLRGENDALREELRAGGRLEGDENTVVAQLQAALARRELELEEVTRELRVAKRQRDEMRERALNAETALEDEASRKERVTRRAGRDLERAREECMKHMQTAHELRARVRELQNELDAVGARRGSRPATKQRPQSAARATPSRAHNVPTGVSGASRGASRHASPTVRPARQPRWGAPDPPRATSNRAARRANGSPAVGQGGSRSNTPGRNYPRPWAERSPLSGFRSASNSPARGRFDPTAWVNQKEDRLARAAQRRTGVFTPPSSRPASRTASREPSRRSTPARDRSSAGSRAGSVDRRAAPQPRRTSGGPARQRGPSPGARPSAGARDVRSASPSQALQAVTDKIAKWRQDRGATGGLTGPETEGSAPRGARAPHAPPAATRRAAEPAAREARRGARAGAGRRGHDGAGGFRARSGGWRAAVEHGRDREQTRGAGRVRAAGEAARRAEHRSCVTDRAAVALCGGSPFRAPPPHQSLHARPVCAGATSRGT